MPPNGILHEQPGHVVGRGCRLVLAMLVSKPKAPVPAMGVASGHSSLGQMTLVCARAAPAIENAARTASAALNGLAQRNLRGVSGTPPALRSRRVDNDA